MNHASAVSLELSKDVQQQEMVDRNNLRPWRMHHKSSICADSEIKQQHVPASLQPRLTRRAARLSTNRI